MRKLKRLSGPTRMRAPPAASEGLTPMDSGSGPSPKSTLVKLSLGGQTLWEEGESLSRGERERRVTQAVKAVREKGHSGHGE
jgi:hypothetical protein